MLDTILLILQCVGVFSFAITGTIIAIRKKTDFIGALFFALLTSFGGGIIRDVTTGNVPRLFTEPHYYIMAIVCVVTSLLCFHLAFIEPIGKFIGKHRHNFFLELTDAIGLSIFCVLGVDATRTMLGEGTIPLILIFGGFITGVGGGMLRDICSAQIPSIFRKDIYLIPAVLGSTLYVFTYPHWHHLVAVCVASALIMTIRLLAYFFKWNMPVHKEKEQK